MVRQARAAVCAEVGVQPTWAAGGCALALDHLQAQVSTHVGQGTLILQVSPPAVWTPSRLPPSCPDPAGISMALVQVEPCRVQGTAGRSANMAPLCLAGNSWEG